ncbi:hypothetical protein [Nitrosomonas sp. Is37]|uniref:hypothetical protein n=1 Tax=Nitrosomonas sp. Is37 TaxID=3080535 RepID=UPI00294B46D2|nr:hypothetical protein [Nitrosomonas sp. Is37]MDV6343969.1 hypothetical protein [Nitrosomonas sp. Is37]
MDKKKPMFDLESCEDVDLQENKTSSDSLVKAKNTKQLRAIRNETGINGTKANDAISWHNTLWGKVILGLFIGGILIVARLLVESA